MRFARAAIALIAPLILAGCGYVHFGRLPSGPTGDAAIAAAYSDLTTAHKILKQELVLARKEGDALRIALERAGGIGPGNSGDIAAQLNKASGELATLRASTTKLQNERDSGAASNAPATGLAKAELEEKLASSLRNYTQLHAENARLREDLERTRGENASLSERLKAAAARDERIQSELAQLNTDLLAQKEARARAEHATAAVRTQLGAVLAHGDRTASASASRDGPVSISSALQIAKAPPAGSSPLAELRANSAHTRVTTDPSAHLANRVAANAPRVHRVQPGDTLESIARQYYGAPERWRAIHDANAALLGRGEALRAGMELQLPEN